MKVAITGASGFVGRHLTRALAKGGVEVVGLVRSARSAALVETAGGTSALVDLADVDAFGRVLVGAQALVHLAQIGAERDGATYEEVNVGGVRRAIAAARQAGVPRIAFLSGLGVAGYGQRPRVTNRYFLSKLAAEVELYRSGLGVTVFRPSYIIGAGDGLLAGLVADMAAGCVEVPGDGAYRMQPIAVADVAALVRAAIELGVQDGPPQVYDLVGPEPLSFTAFLERFGRLVRASRLASSWKTVHIPLEEADSRARGGGYRGMLPDELDCMLCDEVSDAAPLERLLGRPLTSLEDALCVALPKERPS